MKRHFWTKPALHNVYFQDGPQIVCPFLCSAWVLLCSKMLCKCMRIMERTNKVPKIIIGTVSHWDSGSWYIMMLIKYYQPLTTINHFCCLCLYPSPVHSQLVVPCRHSAPRDRFGTGRLAADPPPALDNGVGFPSSTFGPRTMAAGLCNKSWTQSLPTRNIGNLGPTMISVLL